MMIPRPIPRSLCGLFPVAFLLVALSGCASFGGGSAEAAPAPASPEERSNDDPFASVARDAEHLEGFFDLYRLDDGKLYMSVPAERIGVDFLMEYKVARGIGAAGLYGGTMLSIFEADVVAFERRGERLYLVKKPHRFRAEPGTPQAEAVALSFTPSVMESAPIAATRTVDDEDSEYLIDVTSWFVGDLAGLSQRLRGLTSTGMGPGPAPAFDQNRSYLERARAFPKNLNIRSLLTYRAPQPVSTPAISDPRFISIEIHHTIAELPEVPMEPRLADDRVGYFITAHKDFTSDDDTHFVRYVNRWRLECDGPPAADGLCDPVKPITFYLDRTIPEAYHRWFIEGIEAWRSAFEEAGFRAGIRAEMLPDDADADDIRYPTLRWNTSEGVGYSAIGPSVVDPRTGEILDANQLYEASMILGFQRGWRNLVDPRTALELSMGVLDGDPELGIDALRNHAHLAGVLSDQGTFLRAILAARGELGPSEALPNEYVGEAIRWVVMHEVGHTLGLRHNFRSSTDTPMDRLHDREWTRRNGLVSSVMDYHAPNLAPAGAPQGYFYSPTVGSADRWKIAYGYTPDPARADELARLAETEGRTYGTDEDSGGAGAMDPSVNIYDLSSDPLAWGKERTAMIDELWARLPETVLDDNARYAELTAAWQMLLGQYSQAIGPAVKYIGGEFVYRTRPGDPADRGPFVPVTKTEQRDALDFIVSRVFAADAFSVPSEVLSQFGPDRWTHWGFTNTYQGRVDYPFHETIAGLQRSIMTQLLAPLRLQRMRDSELRHGASQVLTIPELFDALTGAVWSETAGSGNVSSVRRDLQRTWLDLVSALVVNPAARTPADARALARRELGEVDRRIGARLSRGGLDAYTRAHFEEARASIAATLAAGVQMER